MVETRNIIDLEPIGSLALATENFDSIGTRFVLYFPLWEREAAVRALTDAQHDDFPARRAYLGRRLTILAVALDLNSDIVDRTEAPDIAGEVQYAAIILAVCLAGTAADLLHVEAGRACRAQHRD